MADPREQEFNIDRADQSDGGESEDSSPVVTSHGGSDATSGSSRVNGGSGSEIGVSERLTDILFNDGDGDLLMQQNFREDRVLQWLQALDMQVMGACRADERLKPLLKMNVSSGIAEDRFLAHLSQHFEPSEVGLLARCFCIPLVTIRVGKIEKQGTLLHPTSARGNLSLALLPTSDLRLSFVGDNGRTERLATFSSKLQCAAVVIEEIPADSSGRSFLVRIRDDRVFYFWCSEKSKLLGDELLLKMKDILKKKPSISELTGISEARLGCFANHLRSYYVDPAASKSQATVSGTQPSSTGSGLGAGEISRSEQLPSSRSPRSRDTNNQTGKASSVYQGSLSPRSSSFKDGFPKNQSSTKCTFREKVRRRGDGQISLLDNLPSASQVFSDLSSSNQSGSEELSEVITSCSSSPSAFLESLGKFAGSPILGSASQVPSLGATFLSPYYCWCPPGMSTLQHSAAPNNHPISSIESTAFPPPSSLVTAVARSSTLLTPTQPLNLADIPPIDFPAFFPDPLARVPLPNSQQIPTFTPLMCDPIVHIPVIDVCSSGQGYLVSAGPAISSSIPPLHPNLVNPLLPQVDPMVEKGARETLRLLISNSGAASPQLMNVLPAVLTKVDKSQGMFATGSRGLYSGTIDVNAVASSVAVLGLVSDSVPSVRSIAETCSGSNVGGQPEGGSSNSCGCSRAEAENFKLTKSGNERTE